MLAGVWARGGYIMSGVLGDARGLKDWVMQNRGFPTGAKSLGN